MSPHMMQRFIMLATAKKIWEAVAKTFYDGSDETRLFELNQKSLSLPYIMVELCLLTIMNWLKFYKKSIIERSRRKDLLKELYICIP